MSSYRVTNDLSAGPLVSFVPYVDAMGQPVTQGPAYTTDTRGVASNGLTGGRASVGVRQSNRTRPVSARPTRILSQFTTPSVITGPVDAIVLRPQFAVVPKGSGVVLSRNNTRASIESGGDAGGVCYQSALYGSPGAIGCWSISLIGSGEVAVGVGSGYTDVTAEPGVDTNEGFSVNLTTGAVFNNGTLVSELTLGAATQVFFRAQQVAAQTLSTQFQIGSNVYGPYQWTYTGDIWTPMVWLGAVGVTAEMNDGSN